MNARLTVGLAKERRHAVREGARARLPLRTRYRTEMSRGVSARRADQSR